MEKNTCPSCGGGIPNNEARGLYVGAISRTDDITEICSACGVQEAWTQFMGHRRLSTKDWWINQQELPKPIRAQDVLDNQYKDEKFF